MMMVVVVGMVVGWGREGKREGEWRRARARRRGVRDFFWMV